MPQRKNRRFSPELKHHALKRTSEDGVTDRSVCKELNVSGGFPQPGLDDAPRNVASLNYYRLQVCCRGLLQLAT
jgi:hypothetical protein